MNRAVDIILIDQIIDNKIKDKYDLYKYINKNYNIKIIEKRNICRYISRRILKDKLIIDKKIIDNIEKIYKGNIKLILIKIYILIDIILNNKEIINSLYDRYMNEYNNKIYEYEYKKEIIERYNKREININSILKKYYNNKIQYRIDNRISNIKDIVKYLLILMNIKIEEYKVEYIKYNIIRYMEEYIEEINKIIGFISGNRILYMINIDEDSRKYILENICKNIVELIERIEKDNIISNRDLDIIRKLIYKYNRERIYY